MDCFKYVFQIQEYHDGRVLLIKGGADLLRNPEAVEACLIKILPTVLCQIPNLRTKVRVDLPGLIL